ncbi:MAG TPA: chemotaxis protein CheW [Nitrospiraceae bacterium]|nr:MAG: hypothetical protein A2Z82_07990 [Nitrospirae bacterium GWA2_46_11]HAK89172.1 chemotaxis protein CheW [Nitrospiraceae bacterium]HCL80708.1 chemotaxis protein CheW [Nitrospiraceae bacterium]
MDALAATSLGEVVEGRQYVTFGLNNEEYAVDALNVQEIIEMASITHVPHLPGFFKGVINLRGTIIPVVDLKLKFDMASEGYRKHTCVIVTEFSGGVMGIIVDSVSDVMHMPEESVSATPSFGSQVRTDFIKGMGKVSDRLVLILDINKVLTEEEASIVSEQLTEAI